MAQICLSLCCSLVVTYHLLFCATDSIHYCQCDSMFTCNDRNCCFVKQTTDGTQLWWLSKRWLTSVYCNRQGANRFLGWVTACLASSPQTVHKNKSESRGHVQCVIVQVMTRIVQLRHLTLASYNLQVLLVYTPCVLYNKGEMLVRVY